MYLLSFFGNLKAKLLRGSSPNPNVLSQSGWSLVRCSYSSTRGRSDRRLTLLSPPCLSSTLSHYWVIIRGYVAGPAAAYADPFVVAFRAFQVKYIFFLFFFW